jgi:molybdate transport system substrate-binding protein
MLKKTIVSLLLGIFLVGVILTGGCTRKEEKKIFVFSGKGLKIAIDEIKDAFEQKHHIKTQVIYAGSITCLNTIKKTGKGDVFIPGSLEVIKKAGGLVDNHQYVALHVPVIGIHKENSKNILSLDDVAKPGVRLAVGNEKTCSIGAVANMIIQKSELREQLIQNTVIKASTSNEVADLIVQKEVDCGIMWNDMLTLPKHKDIRGIQLPADNNVIIEIHVAVLTTSQDKASAQVFADFVASEGKTVFKKYGFGEK